MKVSGSREGIRQPRAVALCEFAPQTAQRIPQQTEIKKKPNQYEIRLPPPTFQRGQQNELRTHQSERRIAVPGDEKFPFTGV